MRGIVIDKLNQVANASEGGRAGFLNLFHNNNLTGFYVKSRGFFKKNSFFLRVKLA